MINVVVAGQRIRVVARTHFNLVPNYGVKVGAAIHAYLPCHPRKPVTKQQVIG